MNVPKSQRKYECHICRYHVNGFNFLKLKKHLNEVHPVEIKCDVCNSILSSWGNLKAYKLTHGEKLLKCRYCPKRYHAKCAIITHEKSCKSKKSNNNTN